MNTNDSQPIQKKEQLESPERYGARAWDGIEQELSGYRGFYSEHKPAPWRPVMGSRGVPRLSLPVLIPCERGKADGRIYYQALNPQRIAEVPVRQLNPRELLKSESPLWQSHLDDTLKLLSAIEADKGISKVIREQLGEDLEFERQAQQNPWGFAASLFNSGLYSINAPVRLAVWWRDQEKKLDLGLYCPDARTAAYALLLSRGTQPIQIGVCQWERCGRRFQRDEWHPNIYCSAKCRNAASQAAFRKRKAARRNRRRR